MIEERFVEDEARLELSPVKASNPDSKTAALLQVGAYVAIGPSAVRLEWSTGRALAAGASEDEIADVLLAIAPVAGLGRVVSAAPGIATRARNDIAAARGRTGLMGCRSVTSACWAPRRRHHDNH
jgi:hypothetical protein